MKHLLFLLLIFCIISCDNTSRQFSQDDPFTGPLSGGKRLPRVIITTDHGTCDYDDIQSLGHLFIYSDVLNIRGIVESHPRCGRDTKTSYVIDAYELDYPNLKTYSENYPTPGHLRSLVVQGNYGSQPSVGYSNASAGSNLIISEAKKASPNDPLWVLVWGAITDVAQALHDDPTIKKSIRVYFIASWNRDQDKAAADYIDREHKDLWYIEDTYTHRGLYQDVGEVDVIEGPPHIDWANVHIKGHGALGDIIMAKGDHVLLNFDGFKAGDTPSLLHVLYGNMDDPSSPGWSGEFQQSNPVQRPDYWADKQNPQSSVAKYRLEIFEDFAKRMDRAKTSK